MNFVKRTAPALCAAALMLVVSGPSLAGESVGQVELDKVAAASGMPQGLSRAEICARFEDLAKAVMTGRQRGASMSGAIDDAGNNEPARLIVVEAYDNRRYISDKMQKRAIEEFAAQQYRSCYHALEK